MVPRHENNRKGHLVYILSNSRSLYSTRRLFEEGMKRGHRMRVYPPINLSMLLDKNSSEIYFDRRMLSKPAAIIPRIGQKKPGYTLAIVRQFEMMGVKTLNYSQAVSRSRDKLRTLQILSQNNIGSPRTFFLDSLADIEIAINQVGGAPIVIKALEGTQGVGVMLAESVRSAKSILETLLNQGQNLLVQEFIAESEGRDTRIIILGDRMIAAMHRMSLDDDFRSNIHRGGSHQRAQVSIEAEKTARKAVKTLGLHFAGVDIIDSKRGPLVLEVNPSPGLEGIETATEVNVAEKCIQYIERELRRGHSKDSIGY